MPKIFGIGLCRTGTLSTHKALQVLGYKSLHKPSSMEAIDQYEATNDMTVACRYRELDRMYLGSKFVLTYRDFESWAFSTFCRMGVRPKPKENPFYTEARAYLYGITKPEEVTMDNL